MALAVTGGGGLALLAGFLLLGNVAGSYELSVILERGDLIRQHALYLPILVLVLLGAFTKSAQFPFHFWLPTAMEAPTPVSAYLHSATMVKAGVYLLARLSPVLSGPDAWTYTLASVGAATMLLGAHLSLLQTDMKRILAYSTVSALGMLTMLIGIGTPLAVKAAVVLLLAHALYKGALFLVAGSVDHEAGTRDITRLAALRGEMPFTALVAVLAGLSMAGVAPLFGFISKEALYEGGRDWHGWALAASFAASVLLVAAAINLGIKPFFGRATSSAGGVDEAAMTLWLPAAVLALLGLVLGLLPGFVDAPFLSAAAGSVLGRETSVSLELWHGFNLVLILSLLTLLGGAVIFAGVSTYRRLLAAAPPWRSSDAVYDRLLVGLNWLAARQTRFLQSGYLRFYLLTVMGVVAAATGFVLLDGNNGAIGPSTNIRFYEAVVGVAIVAGSVIAVLTDSRFTAVAALGVVGYSTGLVYLFFGAPDLAMTQVLVDTLVVVLFAFVFYHLPRFSLLSRPRERLRDAVFCLAAGGLMTLLVLLASGVHPQKTTSQFYLEASQPEAKGDNVVNVILVDFRALDTLGEITVLAAAGLGVLGLLRLRASGGEDQ
jgi:multicomponent Na+:H+ antiporter subunit A